MRAQVGALEVTLPLPNGSASRNALGPRPGVVLLGFLREV